MKNIKILFFGKLKDHWQPSQQCIQTGASNIEELYQELLQSAQSEPHKNSIKVAVNDDFTTWDATICEGDTIAFLPPASGG